MKVYLHGAREGQTIVINGASFVDGVAEVSEAMFHYLASYYGAKSVPVSEKVAEEIIVGGKKPEEDGAEILHQVLESRREQISIKRSENEKLLDEIETSKNFGVVKSFVKKATGITPKNKEHAIQLLKGVRDTT